MWSVCDGCVFWVLSEAFGRVAALVVPETRGNTFVPSKGNLTFYKGFSRV
jgi:hypothetical protein